MSCDCEPDLDAGWQDAEYISELENKLASLRALNAELLAALRDMIAEFGERERPACYHASKLIAKAAS